MVYNLVQSGETCHEDILLQVYDEVDIYTLTYMFERLSHGDENIYDYHLTVNELYYDIWSMVAEMVTKFGVEAVSKLLHSNIGIIRDESIDYSETWTCTDDWE